MRLLSHRRTQQPQGHAERAREGLGHGLVFAGSLANGLTHIEIGGRERPFSVAGAPSQHVTRGGLAAGFNGSDQWLFLNESVLGNLPSGARYTVAAVAIPDDASTRGTIFALGSSVDGDPYIWIEVNQSAGKLSFNTRGDAGAGAISTTSNSFTAGELLVGMGICYSDTEFKAILNGDLANAVSGAGTSTGYTLDRTAIGALLRASAIVPFLGKVLLVAAWDRALDDAEAVEFAANPWQILAPQQIWVPRTTAAHPHATTGSLVSQDSAVSGVAVHPHIASGALASDAAALSGSAVHPHLSSGALAADSAVVSGSSSHQHVTAGALAADSATIDGAAAHLTLHATAGALVSDGSSVAGSAEHAADNSHDATGDLTAQAATASGSAEHYALHTATGDLSSAVASVTGAAAHEHAAAGALVSQAAQVSGAAAHEHVTTGSLESSASTITGAADRAAAGSHDATGSLQSDDGLISGQAALFAVAPPPVQIGASAPRPATAWINDDEVIALLMAFMNETETQ